MCYWSFCRIAGHHFELVMRQPGGIKKAIDMLGYSPEYRIRDGTNYALVLA